MYNVAGIHRQVFFPLLGCMLTIQLFVYKYNKVYFRHAAAIMCVDHYVILGDLVSSVKSSKETSSCLPDSTTDTSSRSSGQTANRPTCTHIHNLRVKRFIANLG